MNQKAKRLQETIASGQYTGENKDLLKSIFDHGWDYLADFAVNKVTGEVAPELAHYGVMVLQYSVNALDALIAGDEDIAQWFIERSLDDGRFEFGRYAIPLVLEIKRLMNRGKIATSPVFKDQLDHFEVAIFKILPSSEQRELIKKQLLFLLKNNINVLMELKSAHLADYTSGIDDADWLDNLRRNLEGSEEILGQQPILVDGKTVTPTIANWLQDYIISSPKALVSRSAFEEVQYLRSSPNVRKLTMSEQQILLQVIKIYSWSANPIVSEEEIEAYENSNEQPADGIGNRTAGLNSRAVSDIQKHKQETELINEKLDELKQKVH